MMYASRAPRWIQALGLRAMPLGLDLRGGLYLLYQVDVDGAVEQLLNTYDQDFRRALSTEKIPFTDITSLTVDSDIPNGLRVLLPAGADLGAVRAALKKAQPDLGCRDADGGRWRRGRLRDDRAAGARTPRLRHHFQHHHAAQSRERARRLRAHRAAAGPRPHHRAAARRAELRRGEGHARQGRDARIPARRSAPDSGEWPRPTGAKIYMHKDGRAGDAQARHHRHRQPADQRDFDHRPAGSAGQTSRSTAPAATDAQDHARPISASPWPWCSSSSAARPSKSTASQSTATSRKRRSSASRPSRACSAIASRPPASSMNEARELALLLRGGALAAPISIANERVIGPQLGKENIEKGVKALVIGMAALFAVHDPLLPGVRHRRGPGAARQRHRADGVAVDARHARCRCRASPASSSPSAWRWTRTC